MFWGSFNGIYATELTDDGLAVKKEDGWNAGIVEEGLWG